MLLFVVLKASAASNQLNQLSQMRRSSLAVTRNRHLTLRQNSSPNRFSVSQVNDGTSSANSMSPMLKRSFERRYSAVPITTKMPPRKSSISVQNTPLAIKRNQFKPAISPLAISGLPFTSTNTTTTSATNPNALHSISSTQSKEISKNSSEK